ncbi:MAG: XRE family transcriptional regulator [Chloroflexi bacterium]|nr:MAG: XRE family transcriptional regulator [Chloroflexota bacterium]
MCYMRNIVGRRVKLARTKIKPRMTQADLAAKLQLDDWDIDRVGVAKIEVGIRQVTDYELVKLAKALNVSAAWLLGETDKRA